MIRYLAIMLILSTVGGLCRVNGFLLRIVAKMQRFDHIEI